MSTNINQELPDIEFLELVRAMIDVSEALKGTPAGENDLILDAEGLYLKTFYHSCSIYTLMKGVRVSPLNINFIDPASIQVMVRASLESALTFFYVFDYPKSNADKEFAYLVWHLSGLLIRQGFHPLSRYGKDKLNKEKEYINRLQEQIRNFAQFNNYTLRQQKDIIEKGKWKLPIKDEKGDYYIPGPAKIALLAGMDKQHAYDIYSYLSSYAHSDYLSVMQTRQPVSAQNRYRLINASQDIAKIAIALITVSYTRVFPKTKPVIENNEKYSYSIETWLMPLLTRLLNQRSTGMTL